MAPKELKVKVPPSPTSSKIAKSKSDTKKKAKARVSASIDSISIDPSKQDDEIPAPNACKQYNIDEVLDIVMEAVNNQTKFAKQAIVTPTADFRKDLGLDLDALIDLSFEFEDIFETWIHCDKVLELKCCEDVARFMMAWKRYSCS